MNEIITCCPNCNAPIWFVTPIDDASLTCQNCGLRQYGRNRVLVWHNKTSRFLSRGITPTRRIT